jgi:hypothetical protein
MTTKAYKLFKIRSNGTIGPLFINARQVIELGEWLPAEDHPTNGFAHRPGWHATLLPVAPHLSERPASGPERAWFEVEIGKHRRFNRPQSQGGTWVLAENMRVVRRLTDTDLATLRGTV